MSIRCSPISAKHLLLMVRRLAPRIYPRYPRVISLLQDQRSGMGAVRLPEQVTRVGIRFHPALDHQFKYVSARSNQHLAPSASRSFAHHPPPIASRQSSREIFTRLAFNNPRVLFKVEVEDPKEACEGVTCTLDFGKLCVISHGWSNRKLTAPGPRFPYQTTIPPTTAYSPMT